MKAMVMFVILLLVIFGINLFWPDSRQTTTPALVNEVATETVSSREKSQQAEQADELVATGSFYNDKLEKMHAEYDKLKQARARLKRRLARLKHEVWGLKFPKQDAKQISDIMLGATQLIKNPAMLGAFSDSETIKDETAKVEFANNSLDEVSAMIKKTKANNKN